MSFNDKLKNKLASGQISTITVDVFDTILMRKMWPEDVQFIKVAEQWLPILKKYFPETTVQEIYSYRIYARQELWHTHHRYGATNKKGDFSLSTNLEYDVNLATWFAKILELLSIKYNKNIQKIDNIADEMAKIELAIEKANLVPNKQLIKQLSDIKHKNPKIKVFFVSDMYLRGREIQEILDYFKIQIFDGGISSTDAGHTKATGKLFDYLHESKILCENFNISSNLHIGDNKISDFDNPIKSGSDAMLVKTSVNRKVNTQIGRIYVHTFNKKIEYHDKEILKRALKNRTSSTSEIWQKYGLLFSQPLFIFLTHLITAAKESPKTNFVMVSSEATEFNRYSKMMYADFEKIPNIIIADKLNRRCMLRAMIWAMAQADTLPNNAEAILNVVYLGEIEQNRRDVYKFILGEQYPCSEMVLNYRNEKHFFAALIDDIRKADVKYTYILKESYNYVKSFLPKDKETATVIVDAGWGGTVQVLFEQFAKMHFYDKPIDGLYIGVMPTDRFHVRLPSMEGYLMPDVKYGPDRKLFCAVLWEYPYTNKPQFSSDGAHLEQIKIGLANGLKLMQNIWSSPKKYFDNVLSYEIRNLVRKPSKKQAKIIGSIEFDMGFANPASFHIVDMNIGKKNAVKLMITHPRFFIKNIVFAANHWPGGFMTYYNMPYLRPIMKIYSKLVKKTLF